MLLTTVVLLHIQLHHAVAGVFKKLHNTPTVIEKQNATIAK